MFLAIGCSSVATGGAGVGYTGGLMVRGSCNSGVGATAPWGGGGNRGGGQQWGCRQPLRTALHNISFKSPKQFELKQSRKALRALNARWALPVYPVFEDEKSKASDEKSVKRKTA